MHKFNHDFSCILAIFAVSLFTRESPSFFSWGTGVVAIFASPSLRGSLPLFAGAWLCGGRRGVSLFTRESPSFVRVGYSFSTAASLPLYEGVSLLPDQWSKNPNRSVSLFTRESPSLRGSGLKSVHRVTCQKSAVVSLFTREWIEISPSGFAFFDVTMSPSLRGSGLKSRAIHAELYQKGVSLFTREWIEILSVITNSPFTLVSLFTREWIEIKSHQAKCIAIRSPSLRGSGLK